MLLDHISYGAFLHGVHILSHHALFFVGLFFSLCLDNVTTYLVWDNGYAMCIDFDDNILMLSLYLCCVKFYLCIFMYVVYVSAHYFFANASAWYMVYLICCIYVILLMACFITFWCCQWGKSICKLWSYDAHIQGEPIRRHQKHRHKFLHHQRKGGRVCKCLS